MNGSNENMADPAYAKVNTISDIANIENFGNATLFGQDDESKRGLTGTAWNDIMAKQEIEKETFESQRVFAKNVKDHSKVPSVPSRYIYDEPVSYHGMNAARMRKYCTGQKILTPDVSQYATSVPSLRPEDYYN
jgi:hypothetical protein